MALQEFVDSRGGDVRLAPDEYQGPLVISRPCTIDGAGATIWRPQGPVVMVRSGNVVLRNLRIELTGPDADQCALRCEKGGVVLENVEVYGLVEGCGFPPGPLVVPRTIDLGVFAADRQNVFVQSLTLPAPARVRADISGLTIQPEELPAGPSQLQITIGGLRSGTNVYGEIFLDGNVIRRMYIRGRAEAGAPVHKADPSAAPPPSSAEQIPRAAAPPRATGPSAAPLRKGERRDLLGSGEVEVRLIGARAAHNMDCYVFCLGPDGMVRGDSGLIFFGNRQSPDSAVRILDGTPGAAVDPARVSLRIDRIVVVFSAYHGPLRVKETDSLQVRVKAGSDRFEYPLSGLDGERTITALHLYRRRNGWRLWCADHRSREGIEALCAQYGVEVE